MKRRPFRLASILSVLLFVSALPSPGLAAPDHAAAATAAKGPETKTVGAGPYLGPTAQERAKLAEAQAAAAALHPQAKLPPSATTGREGANVLTPGELAKVARLVEILRNLALPGMTKPALLAKAPASGVPELTPQERAKRAMELATAPAQAAPGTGR